MIVPAAVSSTAATSEVTMRRGRNAERAARAAAVPFPADACADADVREAGHRPACVVIANPFFRGVPSQDPPPSGRMRPRAVRSVRAVRALRAAVRALRAAVGPVRAGAFAAEPRVA
ncbi:hypothetical protein DZF91_17435, partial [Actinomadura logoneensis]